jgi:polyisoprenyl-teichoic acid--peptidoglycan teichoic acid transferase
LTSEDRDDRDPTRDAPETDGAEAGETPADVPVPATWAGRQRSSEDAAEHDQLPADGPPEEEEVASEPAAAADSDGAGPQDDGAVETEAEEVAESEGAPDEEAGEALDEEAGADGGPDTEERLAQDTVEADTLALGDREAAREAAMAGLRARAADHATKHGTEAITAPPPKTAEPGEAEAEADETEPAAEEPPAQAPPVGALEADEKPPRRGIWPRFVAGSLLIIVAMATATSVSLFFFLNGVLANFHGVKGVQNSLVVAHPGQPQTILILGSDRRPDEPQAVGARSDTTILLRIASDQITVLSIPRDLKVSIPGHGLDKFNAAYTYGGPRLTLKVVKQITGITDINHVVNVDFTGFADAVNAIGCVYVDVDHHYYHSNLGLAASEQYAEIDIPAGYQRMCGLNALSYVRYRHDDNDLVRSARQQDFLRELRQELPATRIADDFNELKDILAKYVTLDINSTGDLLALAQLIVSANSAPVVQVHFPATLGGPTDPYVNASDSAIKAAVAKFEGTNPEPIPGETTASTSGSNGGGGGSKSGGGGGSSAPAPAPAPTLIDATSTAQQTAATLEATKTEGGDKMLDFPLYYPTKLAPDSSILTDDPDNSRAFLIDGPGNEVYRGYKIAVQIPTDGYYAYYGVSGTDWKDPPILNHPDETRTLDGRDYLLSWDGPELRLIGWKTDQASYWVDNTLLNALTPGQMFAIAQSMQKYTG